MRVGEGVEGRGGEDVNLIQKIDGCKTFWVSRTTNDCQFCLIFLI